ncbi:MAG: hypothetical protein C4340_01120, partial [Armatimonadota bacterium]
MVQDVQDARQDRQRNHKPQKRLHHRHKHRKRDDDQQDTDAELEQVAHFFSPWVRTAAALARREGAEVLVTGDSLGQVSSQTLRNMAVIEEASDLPLLRPLLAFDKAEIVAEAKEIGTLDVAILPAEDCCTL